MRKWRWILAVSFALDLLVFLLARPLLIILEGHDSELGWGVLATRFWRGAIGALLVVALIAVWNIDRYFFRRN